MTAVRPDLPVTPPPAAPAPAGVKAAQAAFFRAALGQTGAAVKAPAAPPEPSRTLTPQITATTRAAAAPDPERPLRPGSLLDIRI